MDVVVNVLFIGIAESCLRYDDEETCLGREKCRFGTLASSNDSLGDALSRVSALAPLVIMKATRRNPIPGIKFSSLWWWLWFQMVHAFF